MLRQGGQQHSYTRKSRPNYRNHIQLACRPDINIKPLHSQFKVVAGILCTMLCIGMLTAVNAFAASSSIEGSVRDSLTGKPLPGAAVVLVGTSIGATTRLDGRFTIRDVPPGEYELRTAYVGYRTKVIPKDVQSGVASKIVVELRAIGAKGKEVVVTGQASGQNAAINQQLSSDRIENVVSDARIHELPDANAAESVGKLPGISLIRDGGQATQVIIRGLAPKYNLITIDGVRIPGNDVPDRGVDLSMITSNMLGGIQVTKAITPDMDAAVLGGVVNFTLREATTRKAQLHLLAQGGYDNLNDTYDNYRFVGTFEKRFLDNKFGLFAEGDAEQQNLSANVLDAYYQLATNNVGVPNKTLLSDVWLTDVLPTQQRYDGTLTMDYLLPEGRMGLMNFFSYGLTNQVNRSEGFYPAAFHSYQLNADQHDLIEAITVLDLQKQMSALNVRLKLDNAFTQSRLPYIDTWTFTQYQATGFNTNVDESLPPQQIPALAHDSLQITYLYYLESEYSILRQDNLGASLDFKANINLSSQITSVLKFGGAFTFADRSRNIALHTGFLSNPDAIQALGNEYPWMRATLNKWGPVLPLFADSSFSYGNFLGGGYPMGLPIDPGKMEQVLRVVEKTATPNSWNYNAFASEVDNYWGREYRSAGYGMLTVHFGPDLTFIPGVRYQVLQTLYGAPRDVGRQNQSGTFSYLRYDTTMDLAHGFWLPMVHLVLNPTRWLRIHLAYTNTITYPDFTSITPVLIVGPGGLTYHDYLLKPGTSANYDAMVSLYSNTIGLLSADGFYKKIDNLVVGTGQTYLTSAARYPGIPGYADGYSFSTDINDPYPVYVSGVELVWQTHFWYLPGPLSGLVLDVNYTLANSTARYPYTYLHPYTINIPPWAGVDTVSTYYTERLIDQPDYILNTAIGYDLGGFGARVSMLYNSNIFSAANFWPELRANTMQYLRWDAAVKQNLPWSGLQVYLDLNDINDAKEITINQGTTFPSAIEMYGTTAKLGIRMRIMQ